MRWNLEWLRTFKAIYERGTLSAAAQELFISQPGVSLHLNSLEAYTGYKLFDRAARRMVPTEKGKILYNFVFEPLQKLFAEGKKNQAAAVLKQQLWYSTAADMEHLKKFWLQHFGEHPDFSPNYIVPNISSIIRCLRDSTGFSVVPDFLCRDEIASAKLKLVWEGDHPLENILYFGTRKKTMYSKEIEKLQNLFSEKWDMTVDGQETPNS